ncbi:MAG: leucine-rich repeat protein [Kiritimatiellaeota bacterium]|nr:leucine-rich repeat protein [Kiritimatiellota bacterium]
MSVYSPNPAVRELTLTNCAAAPAFPSPLPLANPIQSVIFGTSSIVNIAGQNDFLSHLLGDYLWQVGSLTLPDTLVGIGDYSFDSCYNLTGPLTIPNSVTWIGDHAFHGCYSLTGTLTIPDSMNEIGDGAFSGTRLQEIFTPSTWVWFGEGVFGYNPSLTAVHYLGWYPNDPGESIYEGSLNAVSYVRAEYAAGWDDYSLGEIVNGPISGGNAIWRDRPIRIGPYDWHLDASTSPSAITNFFGWRFSVTVNGSDLSLTACTAAPAQPCPLNFAYPVSGGYQIVNITGSVTPGGILNTRANKATRLTLPDTLTNIGNYAFYLMGSSLKGSLVIPNTVTNIGSGAFQACSGFDQLFIGSSVTAIGNTAFANCSNLSGTLTIPDSVTDIGNSAFANCSNLSGTLTFPDSVTRIGNSAFNNTGIRQIFSPSAGVTFGQNVFANNPALLAVHYAGGYPASVGGALYNGSSNVISYVTVGNAANWQTNFDADGGTGSITGGTAIWQGQPLRTFNYDWHYVNTTPLSITNALGWTFTVAVNGNSSPYDITIRKCTAAPAFPSPLPLANPVANNALGVFRIVNITSDSGSDNILVPYADQASSLTLPDTLLNIGNWAFGHYCSKLTGPLVIPNAVTNIGDCAFINCEGLTGPLTLPNSVKTIGDSTFQSCNGFTGPLTLPNTLTRISVGTFLGCSGLTGPLNIPNTVTSIGNQAFEGCSGLTGTLVIPNSVHEIGGEAFRSTSFTQIFTPSTGVDIGSRVFGGNPALSAVYYTGNYPSSIDWESEWMELYAGSPNVTSYVTTGNAANWQSNFGADGGTGDIAGGTGKWQGCPIRTYAQNITVSFNGNGAWNGPFTDMTVQIGLSYGGLPDPQRTGHNTPVWTLGGEPVTSATTVTATTNHTLTAQWTANTYTVVFNAGSGGSASPYAQAFTYGTPAALMPNTFTRDGFTFVGWMYYGNTTFYTDGETVLNLTSVQNGTVSLFAQWVPDGLIGEGVMVTQISMSPKGAVTLQWVSEKADYIVYATDDLTLPVAQWTPFTADHPFHPILINSEYDGAELSRDALIAAGLDPDRLFFFVRVVK